MLWPSRLWALASLDFQFGQIDLGFGRSEDDRDNFFGQGRIVDEPEVLVGRCGEPERPAKDSEPQFLEEVQALIHDDVLFTDFDDPSIGSDIDFPSRLKIA